MASTTSSAEGFMARMAGVIAVAVLILVGSSSCGASESCVISIELTYLGDYTYCKNGWDRAECESYDDGIGEVYSEESCEERGFTKNCSDDDSSSPRLFREGDTCR